MSSEHVARKERGDPLTKPTKIENPKKKEDHELERRDSLYSDLLEWLQKFKENLVDEKVSRHRGSHASSSHEVSLEPTRSVDLGEHSFCIQFPQNRNCEICQRTKITKATVQKTTIVGYQKCSSSSSAKSIH